MKLARWPALAASFLVAGLACASPAEPPATAWTLKPDAVMVQGGFGSHVQSANIGLVWCTPWKRHFDSGDMSLHVEASLGEWHTSRDADTDHFTQYGLTPVFRFYPRAMGHGWFVEGGIGANVITPVYHNGTRVFSTAFNFGDLVGVGRRFGDHDAHELSVRVQHFSNACIQEPNPGQNFLQVRYARWF